VVDAMLPVAERPRYVLEPRDAPYIGGAKVQRIAEQVFPSARTQLIWAPSAPDDPYLVLMRHADYPRRSNGGSRVYIDPYTGQVLATVDSRTAASGDALLAWLFPTHNGEIGGLLGRVIVLVAGLMPAVLLVTGFVLWRFRRRAMRRAAQSVAAAT